MNNAITRRNLMTGLALTGAIAMHESPLSAAKGKAFFERIRRPIGLQLYTLGDDVAKDIDGTLFRVAKIGFRDLELPQLYGKTPSEMKGAGDRAGVRFSSIHLGATPNTPATALSMLSPAQRIVDDLGVLGVTAAIMPIMLFPAGFSVKQGEDFRAAIARSLIEGGADTWKRTAALLNEKAAALKPHGIHVGYHNHNMEFAPIGKTSGWEILVSETDKSLVKFELDVGWVVAGGQDPAAFLQKYNGRVRWLHVKDVQASTKTNFALQMDPTEVGSGEQDWTRILPAAHKAGVEHFYLEQEPPFTMQRIDSAAKGFDFLKAVKA